MTPLSTSYQPTLLSASVSGLVILWLITFAGEIYGDLGELRRFHLFRGIGWIVPIFAVNCINLAIQYSFQVRLRGRACATINVFASVTTFFGLAMAAYEIRNVLKPDSLAGRTTDMEWMLAGLLGSWLVIVVASTVFAARATSATRGEKNG